MEIPRYLVSAREGHLQQVFHIFGYLKVYYKSTMVFDEMYSSATALSVALSVAVADGSVAVADGSVNDGSVDDVDDDSGEVPTNRTIPTAASCSC